MLSDIKLYSALFDNSSDCLCDMGLCEFKFIKKLKSRTAVTESVVYTDFCNLNGAFCACNFTNCVAQTTDYVVLFNCDNSACFLCRLDDNFSVNRLDCVNVDKTCVDSLGFKLLNSL